MKIDVVDMGDTNLGNQRANMVRPYSDAIFKMYPMSNGIVQMVDEVYNFVSASGSLNVMRIWGHGWAGGQLIAAGADGQSGVDNASALWGPNIETYAYYIQKLSVLFASDGRLELKGCSVGQGTDGEKFLIRLAVVLGYPVQASSVTQGGTGSQLSSKTGVGWDGQVVEATSDYTIKYVQGSAM
jgi:hypothetical protein